MPTPVGVSSLQPARKRSTRTPGDAGRRAGSIDKAARRAVSRRAATSLGTPFHFGTPPVGASPVTSANAVAPRLNTSAARVDTAPPAISGAEPGSAAARSFRHRDRRRAEVDDHDPAGAVDDQVGRFDVAMYDAVPVQERQYLGGLGRPPQHARDRESRAPGLHEHHARDSSPRPNRARGRAGLGRTGRRTRARGRVRGQ